MSEHVSAILTILRASVRGMITEDAIRNLLGWYLLDI